MLTLLACGALCLGGEPAVAQDPGPGGPKYKAIAFQKGGCMLVRCTSLPGWHCTTPGAEVLDCLAYN